MLHYQDYLQLDRILNAQILESDKAGKPVHEEMLFIITHQAYELWFKQILVELDAVIRDLDNDRVSEEVMLIILSRLQRIEIIFHLLIQQFKVIETLTPMEFLEFRDFLIPASGFQSFQFRALSIRLGISETIAARFSKHLREKDHIPLEQIKKMPNLMGVVDSWLARTPFVFSKDFAFWKDYIKAMENFLRSEREIIRNNAVLSEQDKVSQLKKIDINEQCIRGTIEEELYSKKLEKEEVRFSYKAMLSALFIFLYRDHPALHTAYQILSTIVKIDSLLTDWMHAHISLVVKVIGNKIGTGETSGAFYLSRSAEEHRIFKDLIAIPTLIMRRSEIPLLPEEIRHDLSFNYVKNKGNS